MPDLKTIPPGAVLALPADLIFSARIRATAQAVGSEVVIARNPDELLTLSGQATPRLVVIDLDRRGLDISPLITELKARTSAPILAYVSHVREDAVAEARAAGADRVLARGAFVRDMAAILKGDP